MKILIYNDTRPYHCGCEAVMDFIEATLVSQGHELRGGYLNYGNYQSRLIKRRGGVAKRPISDEDLAWCDAVLVERRGRGRCEVEPECAGRRSQCRKEDLSLQFNLARATSPRLEGVASGPDQGQPARCYQLEALLESRRCRSGSHIRFLLLQFCRKSSAILQFQWGGIVRGLLRVRTRARKVAGSVHRLAYTPNDSKNLWMGLLRKKLVNSVSLRNGVIMEYTRRARRGLHSSLIDVKITRFLIFLKVPAFQFPTRRPRRNSMRQWLGPEPIGACMINSLTGWSLRRLGLA